MATSVNDHVFRITYEAFAKFSNKLGNCRTLEEIGRCLQVNLKYLFNFHVFRASFLRGNNHFYLTIEKNAFLIDESDHAHYLPYEKEIMETGLPLRKSLTTMPSLPAAYFPETGEEGELWAWYFKHHSGSIIISLVALQSKSFSNKDIVVLKLVTENLEAKLLELNLFRELDEKNKNLNEALIVINEKNNMISRIVDQQKEIIRRRTREVEEKNKRLIEVALLNAHNVREPLSRILGLISLIDDEDDEILKNEIIPKIKTSSDDLDIALQKVINKASSYSTELKA